MRILIDTTNPSDALALGFHSPAGCGDGGFRLTQDKDGHFLLTGVGGEIMMDAQEAREIAKMILNRVGA